MLPLFLVLLIGMVDFGKGFNYWINQTHIASQGARFAVVNRNPGESDGETLQEYIRRHATTDELENGGTRAVDNPLVVCVEFPDGDDPKAGDPVTVTVRTTYDWMPFLDANIGVSAVTIEGSATMRLEAAPTNYLTADNSEDC